MREIRAYGAPIQQDYATFTYTQNGQVETVMDANFNISKNEYDGFDRLFKSIFPGTTRGTEGAPNQPNTADFGNLNMTITAVSPSSARGGATGSK